MTGTPTVPLEPFVAVNVTVPAFATPRSLVTVASRVMACALELKVATAGLTLTTVPAADTVRVPEPALESKLAAPE
jgi:hypothetical protein